MSTYTISPIPTGGGTMSIDATKSAWVYLGNNKYMIFFAQTTPNLTFAQIVIYNHLTNPDTGMAQIVRSNYAGIMRAFSVGNNKVVLFYLDLTYKTLAYQFLTYDESNNITAGEIKTLLTIYGTTAGCVGIGQTSNTNFRIHYSTALSTRNLRNFTIDTTTETITQAANAGYTIVSTTSNVSARSYRIQPIPGTSRFLEYSGQLSSGMSSGVGNIINADGSLYKALTGYHYYFTPISDSKIFNIYSYNYTGVATNAPTPIKGTFVQSNSNTTTYTLNALSTITTNSLVNFRKYAWVSDIVPLSEYHFMALYYDSTATSTVGAMVMRFLDDTYIEVSDPTEQDGGLSLGFDVAPTGHFSSSATYASVGATTVMHDQTGHYLGQPSFHKLNDSTILYWYVATNQLCYKVIYQAI